MKRNLLRLAVAAALMGGCTAVFAAHPTVTIGGTAVQKERAKVHTSPTLTIEGAGSSQTFSVNASNLADNITVTATAGYEVYPNLLPANAKDAQVRVTLLSTMPQTDGKVILRSGDFRAEVPLIGHNTLEQKALSANPLYKGADKNMTYTAADGFTPGKDGYTIEFRVRFKSKDAIFDTHGVAPGGYAFQSYVGADNMGFYNASSKMGFENPYTSAKGGKKQFYNQDGEFHTYRYAVTSDQRVFVYRDGLLVATERTQDYAPQAAWATDAGEMTENLLKNPGFEGEYNYRSSDSLLYKIEGWIVDPIDAYNCNYDIANLEINNELDHYNHVAMLKRYNWNDGWGAGTISQIVNVAPNSTYSLSFLAQGGMDTKSGTNMSSVRIQEVQDDTRGTSVTITNKSDMKPYGCNYTTSADCRQIRVVLHNERFLNGGGWGSSPQPTYIDEMVLSGMSRGLVQELGFSHSKAELDYFTYDPTGAYAPVNPVLRPETEKVVLNGYGTSRRVKVNIADLVTQEPVKVSATHGFTVYPEVLDPSKDGEILITYASTLPEYAGQVVLRSGDLRSYISLVGRHETLEPRDIRESQVAGLENGFEHTKGDGFTPGENGYTVEFRAKLKQSKSNMTLYAVTEEDNCINAYIQNEEIGLCNGTSKVSIPNPATAATGGREIFYNFDDKYHTFRYAVTPDKRVFVYRDGLLVATLRTSDFGHDASWCTEDGELCENLIRNGGFEGQFERRSDNEVNRIDGWVPSPIDQYNCQYDITNLEIDREFDHDNHVMKLQRYNWNDGWAAGTVSQIVDVAPNSTYSLAFLAQGGMDKKSGANMSSVKIQEVQDETRGASVTINNESGMRQYGLNYTTSPDCRQIKVVLHNERFLNGGGWGSSPQATYIDEVQLSGMSRKLDQKIGFDNQRCEVEYFAYDLTGAYAPLEPGIEGFSGVDEQLNSNGTYAARTANGVVLANPPLEATVTVYDAVGKVVAIVERYIGGTEIPLPRRGVYLCTVKGKCTTRTYKVMY